MPQWVANTDYQKKVEIGDTLYLYKLIKDEFVTHGTTKILDGLIEKSENDLKRP